MADQIGGASGNATAADLLSGYTASVSSGPISGSMPNNGSPTLHPGASITSGYYAGGSVANTPHGNVTYSTAGTYTFTVPTDVTQIVAAICGGGGGGGGGNSSIGGRMGAPGGTAVGVLSVTPGAQYTIALGSGGAPGAANASGSAGTNSTFSPSGNSATLTGNGGVGGGPGYSAPQQTGGHSGGVFVASGENTDGYESSTYYISGSGDSFFASGGSGTKGAGGTGGPLNGTGGKGADGYCQIWW